MLKTVENPQYTDMMKIYRHTVDSNDDFIQIETANESAN